MWQKITAGWMVVSLVMLGVPMVALAGDHTAYKQEMKMEQAVTEGKPIAAQARVQQVRGVLQAQEDQNRRMMGGPPVAKKPPVNDLILGLQIEAAEGYVQKTRDGLISQINQITKVLQWVTSQGGSALRTFLNATGPIVAKGIPRYGVGGKKLTDAVGKPVGAISWTYGYVGGRFVVTSITYEANFSSSPGNVRAEASMRGYIYFDNRPGMMPHATGGGRVHITRYYGVNTVTAIGVDSAGGLVLGSSGPDTWVPVPPPPR